MYTIHRDDHFNLTVYSHAYYLFIARKYKNTCPHLPVWTALQLELLDQGGDLVVGLYEPLPGPAVHRGQAHWAWGGGVKNLLLSLCSTVVIQYRIVQYSNTHSST